MTTDFDCTVSGNRCTNRGSTRDDSWSGDLAAGNHSVEVFPFQTGPGNYSLTVTVTETVAYVATPLGSGPVLVGRICDEDEDGDAIEDTCLGIYADSATATGEDPGDDGPPPGAGPGEGTPGPEDGGDGGDGGGGGGESPGHSRDLDGNGVVDNYLAVVAELLRVPTTCRQGRDSEHPAQGAGHTPASILTLQTEASSSPSREAS